MPIFAGSKDRHHYDNNEPIFKEKQYMWYKVRELQSKGLNKTQIGKHLGVDRSTVRRYLQMSREDFVRRRNSHRKYTLKLAGYEEYVRGDSGGISVYIGRKDT